MLWRAEIIRHYAIERIVKMSVGRDDFKDELAGKARKKRGRGSVNNAKRLDAFKARREGSGADWGGCSPDKIQGVVEAITNMGGAVTFGLSRDQGAHSLTLLLDGSRETLWFNGSADLDSELTSVLGLLATMTE